MKCDQKFGTAGIVKMTDLKTTMKYKFESKLWSDICDEYEENLKNGVEMPGYTTMIDPIQIDTPMTESSISINKQKKREIHSRKNETTGKKYKFKSKIWSDICDEYEENIQNGVEMPGYTKIPNDIDPIQTDTPMTESSTSIYKQKNRLLTTQENSLAKDLPVNVDICLESGELNKMTQNLEQNSTEQISANVDITLIVPLIEINELKEDNEGTVNDKQENINLKSQQLEDDILDALDSLIDQGIGTNTENSAVIEPKGNLLNSDATKVVLNNENQMVIHTITNELYKIPIKYPDVCNSTNILEISTAQSSPSITRTIPSCIDTKKKRKRKSQKKSLTKQLPASFHVNTKSRETLLISKHLEEKTTENNLANVEISSELPSVEFNELTEDNDIIVNNKQGNTIMKVQLGDAPGRLDSSIVQASMSTTETNSVAVPIFPSVKLNDNKDLPVIGSTPENASAKDLPANVDICKESGEPAQMTQNLEQNSTEQISANVDITLIVPLIEINELKEDNEETVNDKQENINVKSQQLDDDIPVRLDPPIIQAYTSTTQTNAAVVPLVPSLNHETIVKIQTIIQKSGQIIRIKYMKLCDTANVLKSSIIQSSPSTTRSSNTSNYNQKFSEESITTQENLLKKQSSFVGLSMNSVDRIMSQCKNKIIRNENRNNNIMMTVQKPSEIRIKYTKVYD